MNLLTPRESICLRQQKVFCQNTCTSSLMALSQHMVKLGITPVNASYKRCICFHLAFTARDRNDGNFSSCAAAGLAQPYAYDDVPEAARFKAEQVCTQP